MKKSKDMKGFTLIEILVTVVLVAGIGAIASISLFSMMRGASKSEIIKEIKQNGDFAINQMERQLRNGKIADIDCTNTAETSLPFTDLSGNTPFTFTCGNFSGVNRISDLSGNFYTANTVNVSDCRMFTCSFDPSLNSKTVTINFTLVQANTSAIMAESASQDFRVQVTMRNN